MLELDTNQSFLYMWYNWRFLGVFPYKNYKWLYNFYSISINFIFSVLSPIFVFINVFFLGDLGEIMHNLQISPTLIICSLKQLVVFMRLSNLLDVKTYLNKLDERASRNKDETLYLKSVIRQCHLISLVVLIVLSSSLASYAVPGLIHRKLLFEGWFPFDWTASTRNYYMAYTFQLLATAFQILQNTGNDAYPPIYINVLKGQIRALHMRVARIGKDPNLTSEENFIELKSCVNDHKNIIRLFETIRPAISDTVLIQFVITGSVLCITMVYYVLFNNSFGQLISTLVYVAGLMSECFPVCYFGNSLMSETHELTTAIYNCNWVDQSPKFRACVIIFMQRSQQNNVFLAGGLATISLQTFIAIIRFSFSMYTVLSQMNK